MTKEYPIKSPRKLIEVALPLDVINKASVRESYIYRGNPSSVHKWWAQRPLAAARAVLFAQLVNDPGFQSGGGFKHGINKQAAAQERLRLFEIVSDLVTWENTGNQSVLGAAQHEIERSWREVCQLNKNHPNADYLFNESAPPSLLDLFAGGGTIPLEAQRLGLKVKCLDLNPVAVLINKALMEIPPQLQGHPPVSPIEQNRQLIAQEWNGLTGLQHDLSYYGDCIHARAKDALAALYPTFSFTDDVVRDRPDLSELRGTEGTIISWLWARTVKSPNPAFSHADVPLASTFVLSSKKGKQVYIEPVINGSAYTFAVRVGQPPVEYKKGTSVGKRRGFRCVLSGSPIDYEYIRQEGKARRMGQRLLAIVVKTASGRVYLPPTEAHEELAQTAVPQYRPEIQMPRKHRNFQPPVYGMDTFGDLFTSRQLVALSTFSDLVKDIRQTVYDDAIGAGLPAEECSANGRATARTYADGVVTYLSFALDKTAEYNCMVVPWYAKEDRPKGLFSRQAIPMVWDFAEVNPLADIGGCFTKSVEIVSKALAGCPCVVEPGDVAQGDARSFESPSHFVVSTDPPYYDNINYADLSDFFYSWLRPTLREVFPVLFSTVAVPKADELVASPTRHGGRETAESFFLEGMSVAMRRLAEQSHPALPLTIYYAFKQSETEGGDSSSTGWVTFLDAVIRSGLSIVGTWPMRTERGSRSVAMDANALASCVVLVCRKRGSTASAISRREFLRELNQVLPEALDEMTRGIGEDQSPVAPVDLSQAIIGPGMAVFSKYSAVLEADGEPMTVRTALQLINRFLAEDDFDKDTQFCLHWFEEYGWEKGAFGQADVLARAKATAVDALDDAGVIESGGGNVRLLRWSEYPSDWDPATDSRTPVWEALHHLIRGLKQGGESAAGELLAGVQSQAEAARQLAYRLYTLCERKGWAEDAGAYNELITSWSGIETAAPRVEQKRLF